MYRRCLAAPRFPVSADGVLTPQVRVLTAWCSGEGSQGAWHPVSVSSEHAAVPGGGCCRSQLTVLVLAFVGALELLLLWWTEVIMPRSSCPWETSRVTEGCLSHRALPGPFRAESGRWPMSVWYPQPIGILCCWSSQPSSTGVLFLAPFSWLRLLEKCHLPANYELPYWDPSRMWPRSCCLNVRWKWGHPARQGPAYVLSYQRRVTLTYSFSSPARLSLLKFCSKNLLIKGKDWDEWLWRPDFVFLRLLDIADTEITGGGWILSLSLHFSHFLFVL